MQAIVIRW